MPLLPLPELRALLAKEHRLIGIDPGTKTIGLALSDVRLTLASPFGSLRRGKLKANAADVYKRQVGIEPKRVHIGVQSAPRVAVSRERADVDPDLGFGL